MAKRSLIPAALPALLLAFAACGATDDGATDVLGEGTLDAVSETTDPGAGGYYPPTATPQQIAALKQLNLYRVAAGVPPVDEDERLNQSSQAHAQFIVKNCSNYASSGLSPHDEDPGWGDGFTGELPWDRMKHFGYQAPGMSEVIAFLNSPAGSVTGWIDTLYHRLPLLDPTTIEVGYGGAAGGGPARSRC